MDANSVRDVLADSVARRLYESVELTRLAYTARDGGPRVIPIGYVWNGTHFIVCTSTNAAKVQALTDDPRVALTIDTDTFPPNVLLVRGTAAIEIIEGIPDEYLATNRKRTSEEQFAQWETRCGGSTRRWHGSRSARRGQRSSTLKRASPAQSKS